VQHRAQPPDFRYVWLLPGNSGAALGITTGALCVAATSIGLWKAGHPAFSFVLTLAAGASAVFAFARSEPRVPARIGAREVAMAIVPWGVIVTPDTEPRTLRWPVIRRVTVDVSHTLRGGTPSIVSSLVTIETDREVLAGRTSGAVDLERLLANLDAYAAESARPVAKDLDGFEAFEEDVTEPLFDALLREARELCSTGDGATRLSLPSGGYRNVSSRLAGPETIGFLRETLRAGLETPADPRPLAAIVAGLLGAHELTPDLIRLVSSPHPLVAACAKAAALRLGAPQSRAGAVDEVSAFLFEEDLEHLDAWAKA
jgi:hypothetical protein